MKLSSRPVPLPLCGMCLNSLAGPVSSTAMKQRQNGQEHKLNLIERK